MDRIASPTDLKDARKKGLPWHAVVKALRRMEETSGTDEFGRSWVKVAAEQSAYTVNQLRQMDRTMATLETLVKEHSELSMASALTMPFSHLEIIARISKADADAARRFLSDKEISARRSFRDLRDFYYQARSKMTARSSSRSVAYRSIHEFNRLAFKVISNANVMSSLFRDDPYEANQQLVKWPGGSYYASPDFVAVDKSRRSRTIYAFECISILGDVNREAAYKAIIKPNLESTFFDKYFLVVPFWSDCNSLIHNIFELNLTNIGIIMVGKDGTDIRLMPGRMPYPDRRDILRKNSYIMNNLNK